MTDKSSSPFATGERLADQLEEYWMSLGKPESVTINVGLLNDVVQALRSEIMPNYERCFDAACKALERLNSVRSMWNGPIHIAAALLRDATGPQPDAPASAPSATGPSRDKGQDITKEWHDERADEVGVERLAKEMTQKLLEKRLAGYYGWNNDCTVEHLEGLLKKHIEKPWTDRNLVDMANFCMMLWNRAHPMGAADGGDKTP